MPWLDTLMPLVWQIVQYQQPNHSRTQLINILCLTSKQVEILLSLIDSPKNGYEKLSGEPPWMIDSGTSKHMIGDLCLLTNTKAISPIIIDLPNGDQTIATKQGSVALGSFGLSDMLYVHKLSSSRLHK